MKAHVEGAISCSKQHSRVVVVCATMPTRFWLGATVDFACKKNFLRAKLDEHGDLSTVNGRMQPVFAGLYQAVAILFGSRVTMTGYLPREHLLVKKRINGSFGDHFVEGTYLRADHGTPCIRMYLPR